MSITNNTRADLDTQVASLKDAIAAANRRRVRAEHDRDAAAAQAHAAREQLQRDFGVSTVAQAQAKLDDLRAGLQSEINQLRTALDGLDA